MTKQSDLLRLIEGECSPEEAAAIQGWVAADPRRGELLDDLRAVWRPSGEGTRDWGPGQTLARPPHAPIPPAFTRPPPHRPQSLPPPPPAPVRRHPPPGRRRLPRRAPALPPA